MPSITESGRARYTYSKMQGFSAGGSAHWRACKLPLQVDEDGLARRHVALQPVAGAFQRHRLAGHHDVARRSALPRPKHSGRMP
jgi:hypothetical protein